MLEGLLRRDRVALNPLQWINLAADPTAPGSTSRWRYTEPGFRDDYPNVLKAVRASGWDAVMMEVLPVQTLQDYSRIVADAGLTLAPGYASISLPEDHDVELEPGSAERIQWFDQVRRKAEESAMFGLPTIFLAPEVGFGARFPRTSTAVAVGASFDAGRLERQIGFLGEAAEVLAGEGVRAGLHNHVGTWVETETEIDQVLAALPDLGASFDVGHLVWAGIDPIAMLTRHADRLIDLHIKDLALDVATASRATPTGYSEATDAGIFLEPGRGGIDLDGVLAAIPPSFNGWVIIEVDRASIPAAESARISRDWVETRLKETA